MNQGTATADCWCGNSIAYVTVQSGLLSGTTGEAGEVCYDLWFCFDHNFADDDAPTEQLLFVQWRQCIRRSSWRLWQLHGQHDCDFRAFLLRMFQGDKRDTIALLMVKGAVSSSALALWHGCFLSYATLSCSSRKASWCHPKLPDKLDSLSIVTNTTQKFIIVLGYRTIDRSPACFGRSE